MAFSFLVPLAVLASILTGLIMLAMAVISAIHRGEKTRWNRILVGLFLALFINAWWLAFVAMAIYKFAILGEDM